MITGHCTSRKLSIFSMLNSKNSFPTELQLNKANSSETETPFLDLNLSITNGIVSSKIYDKRTEALEGHFYLLLITYYLLLITYYLLLITYYYYLSLITYYLLLIISFIPL